MFLYGRGKRGKGNGYWKAFLDFPLFQGSSHAIWGEGGEGGTEESHISRKSCSTDRKAATPSATTAVESSARMREWPTDAVVEERTMSKQGSSRKKTKLGSREKEKAAAKSLRCIRQFSAAALVSQGDEKVGVLRSPDAGERRPRLSCVERRVSFRT